MGSVLFYDQCAYRKYSSSSLNADANGIGGSESTVIRIAQKLAEQHRVVVMQTVREAGDDIEEGGVSWMAPRLTQAFVESFDHVIVVRLVGGAVRIRRLSRRVPVTVWYHDWYDAARAGEGFRKRIFRQLKRNLKFAIHHFGNVGGLGVSATHESDLQHYVNDCLLGRLTKKKARLGYIYNPIAPGLKRVEPRSFDPNKLLFASAPWKGLDLVLARFAELRRAIPELTLHVASPGYQTATAAEHPGVVYLGSLKHERLIEELRSALCLFYPADRVPETFGLVFAESNAVGTPVIAHPFGAAPEILTSEQVTDARDASAILDKVRAWREGARPVVSGRPDFEIDAVIATWTATLFPDESAQVSPRAFTQAAE